PDGRSDYFNSFEGSVTRRLAGSWSLLAAYTATKYHKWLVGYPQRGMSLRLLKFSGGSGDDYAICRSSLAAVRPSCRSRARSAATSIGMSAYPFTRRKPFTASKTPAATHRSII